MARSTHIYPLDVARTEPLRLRDIPLGHYVQVLRCDESATLKHGRAGHGIPAAPGVVFHATDAVYLHSPEWNYETSLGVIGPTQQNGFLVLASYETRDDVVDVAGYARAWATQALGADVADNGAIFAEIQNPSNDTMILVTGVSFGFSATPAASGLQIVSLSERHGNQVAPLIFERTLYQRFRPNDDVWHDVFFPFPLLGRPGKYLRLSLPASNTAGVWGMVRLFGGFLSV